MSALYYLLYVLTCPVSVYSDVVVFEINFTKYIQSGVIEHICECIFVICNQQLWQFSTLCNVFQNTTERMQRRRR